MSGVTAHIGAGANLGDRRATLRDAVAALQRSAEISVIAVSPLYETAPVGGPGGQDRFLNAAFCVQTTLAAAALLAVLHQIEADHERTRDVRWGPRTLDLDLLLYGDVVADAEALTLPHPRLHVRRFVLAPLADIAPDARHPLLGRTVARLLSELPDGDPGDVARLEADWADDVIRGGSSAASPT